VRFFFDHYGVLIEIFSNQNTLQATLSIKQLEQGLIGKIKEFLCV
jgi:hypothetical protein